MRPLVALVVVAVIVMLVIAALYAHTSPYEDYLYGFWAATDDEFCAKSEIASMMVFIGAPETTWTGATTRVCYLVIMPDMANQSFTLSYGRAWTGPMLSQYRLKADVDFDGEAVWTGPLDIRVDMRTGILKVYGGGPDIEPVLYAKLYKQNDTTYYCRALDQLRGGQ